MSLLNFHAYFENNKYELAKENISNKGICSRHKVQVTAWFYSER